MIIYIFKDILAPQYKLDLTVQMVFYSKPSGKTLFGKKKRRVLLKNSDCGVDEWSVYCMTDSRTQKRKCNIAANCSLRGFESQLSCQLEILASFEKQITKTVTPGAASRLVSLSLSHRTQISLNHCGPVTSQISEGLAGWVLTSNSLLWFFAAFRLMCLFLNLDIRLVFSAEPFYSFSVQY